MLLLTASGPIPLPHSPVECGGGLLTRTASCRNTTSGADLPDYICGKPPVLSEPCNTQSCSAGCGHPLEEREPCGAYYEDPRSGYDSDAARQDACTSYGCCWAAENTRGFQCYKSSSARSNGCAFDYDGARNNVASANGNSSISQCGDQCCRGDSSHGSCAWTLGYARIGESAPCGRFAGAAKDADPNGWLYHGPDTKATCSYLEASEQKNAKDCKAMCKSHDKCNTANFHSGESICELLDCGLSRSPPKSMSSIGWEVYVWASLVNVRWEVPEWSRCRNTTRAISTDPMFNAWSGGECSLSQQRDVTCFGTDGTGSVEAIVADSECIEFMVKPESERT